MINPDAIPMPFEGFLMNLELTHFNQVCYFERNTLFWSVSRLFECYYRINIALQEHKNGQSDCPFLAGDIETFIIRHRIIMNDIAQIIRKFYPKNARGMPGLSSDVGGKVAPMNREQSFNKLYEFFVTKNPSYHTELTEALKEFEEFTWRELGKRREDVIHYKAKVLIFYPLNEAPCFAFIDPAQTMPTIPTVDGGKKLVTKSVFDFVNETMTSTINFINVNLLGVYKNYATKEGWKYREVIGTPEATYIGSALYKQINNL